MKQDIKNLNEIINLCNEELDNKNENVTAVLDLTDLLSLRNLIKLYKKLEEKWDKDTHKLQNALDMANADKINNYIPVSLVEETIEKLNKEEKQELKGLKGQDRYFVKQMYQYKRSVLQKLLEKRK